MVLIYTLLMINDVRHFFQVLIVYMYIIFFLKFYFVYIFFLAPGKGLESWALRLKCDALPFEISGYLYIFLKKCLFKFLAILKLGYLSFYC